MEYDNETLQFDNSYDDYSDYSDYSSGNECFSEFTPYADDYSDYGVYSANADPVEDFFRFAQNTDSSFKEIFNNLKKGGMSDADAAKEASKRVLEDIRRGTGAGRAVNNALAHVNKHKLIYGGVGAAGLLGGGLLLASRRRRSDDRDQPVVIAQS